MKGITKYAVRLTFIEPLLGGQPKNKAVYTDHVAAKAALRHPELVEDGTLAEEAEFIEDLEEKGWTGFHSDENGIYVWAYQIRGALKEAATALKDSLGPKGEGIKNLRSKVVMYVHVLPRRICIAAAPDGVLERPLRAQTMKGPRVSLSRSDYVNEGLQIEFQIHLLPNKEINEDVLRTLLEYGEYNGLLQWRSGPYGKYTFELTKLDSDA